MATDESETATITPGVTRSNTQHEQDISIDNWIPLRIPTIGPELYNLPVPPVRYRIDLKHEEGSAGLVGWFANQKPFRLQVEESTKPDSPKPVLEVVSEIKGSHRAKQPMYYILPPAPLQQPPSIVTNSHLSANQPTTNPPPTPPPAPSAIPGYNHIMMSPTNFDDVMITEIVSTKVIIYSTHVIEFLRSMITYYPQQNLLGDTVTVPEPFGCLLHSHENIKQAINNDVGREKEIATLEAKPTAKQAPEGFDKASHLHTLLDFIEMRLEVQGLAKLSITPSMTITFDSLWFLFEPGEDVYFVEPSIEASFPDTPIWQCAVISDCDYGPSQKESKVLRIRAWILGCDGKCLDRSLETMEIPRFSDETDPTTFRVVPARLWDSKDNGRRRKELVNRGTRVLELLRAEYKEMWCSGRALRPKSTGEEYHDVAKPFKGKVVLDIMGVGLYSKLGNPQEITAPSDTMIHLQVPDYSSDPNPPRKWSEYEGILLKGSQLTEHQLLLLGPFLSGFALGPKEWIVFSVDSLTTIDRTENPLKNLVIPSKRLDFIKSLALQTSSPQTQWSADFVHGKGSGHIVLLHGPPGVGKTYTVECIAEHIARPLINLTIADIGIEETSIESQLDKFFAFAERWRAILLIDEADIFLERRKAADIARNGIVSVFLRKTEYFSGMLFLTTNRVGLVDDAFISRAHVVLEYEALTDESRKSMWEAFFTKLRKETKGKIVVTQKAKDYIFHNDDIKNLKWNGREIRNALQTTITLAQYDAHEDRGAEYDPEDAISITEDHFSRVADMSKSFKDFLFKLYGRTEAQRPQDRREHL